MRYFSTYYFPLVIYMFAKASGIEDKSVDDLLLESTAVAFDNSVSIRKDNRYFSIRYQSLYENQHAGVYEKIYGEQDSIMRSHAVEENTGDFSDPEVYAQLKQTYPKKDVYSFLDQCERYIRQTVDLKIKKDELFRETSNFLSKEQLKFCANFSSYLTNELIGNAPSQAYALGLRFQMNEFVSQIMEVCGNNFDPIDILNFNINRIKPLNDDEWLPIKNYLSRYKDDLTQINKEEMVHTVPRGNRLPTMVIGVDPAFLSYFWGARDDIDTNTHDGCAYPEFLKQLSQSTDGIIPKHDFPNTSKYDILPAEKTHKQAADRLLKGTNRYTDLVIYGHSLSLTDLDAFSAIFHEYIPLNNLNAIIKKFPTIWVVYSENMETVTALTTRLNSICALLDTWWNQEVLSKEVPDGMGSFFQNLSDNNKIKIRGI